jgi:hypothetical protein
MSRLLSAPAFLVLALVATATPALAQTQSLQQQARTRLNHLNRAYGKSKTTVSLHSVNLQVSKYRHIHNLRVDAARPLISIGPVKLLHWNITHDQAVKRLSNGKPVRFGVRSSHISIGGEPHFRSYLVGPRCTTTSIPKMLQWTRAAETYMAKWAANGQLALPLGD